MMGHGWQLIDAAPDNDARPTLFAPGEHDSFGRAAPAREEGSPHAAQRRRPRLRLVKTTLRALSGGAERRSKSADAPPRWPPRDGGERSAA